MIGNVTGAHPSKKSLIGYNATVSRKNLVRFGDGWCKKAVYPAGDNMSGYVYSKGAGTPSESPDEHRPPCVFHCVCSCGVGWSRPSRL